MGLMTEVLNARCGCKPEKKWSYIKILYLKDSNKNIYVCPSN